MSAEKRKVLEMLAAGKITAEDAERLLDKLNGSGAASEPAAGQGGEASASPGQKPRYLRVVVDSPESDQVNVRVPLSLLRGGIGLLAVLPPRVSEKLAEKGIDLSALSTLKGQELLDALQDLQVDVGGPGGKKVRIFCE
jgi:hypothetical protein